MAKNVVAAGLARRCELQLAYAIGVAHPLAVNVQTWGTGTLADHELAALIERTFDLRPGAIIERSTCAGRSTADSGLRPLRP